MKKKNDVYIPEPSEGVPLYPSAVKKEKQQMGWPEAATHIFNALAVLGIIYFFASCMHGGPLL